MSAGTRGLSVVGALTVVANVVVAALAAREWTVAGGWVSTVLGAVALCGACAGGQLVGAVRPAQAADRWLVAAVLGAFWLAVVGRDGRVCGLATAMFTAYVAVHVLASRRWRAIGLALIGGPAMLINLASVAVIIGAVLAPADGLSVWLGLLAVARSCAGGVWGGRVMLGAARGMEWHGTFGVWMTLDLIIGVLQPSTAALALTFAAAALHCLVSKLCDSRGDATRAMVGPEVRRRVVLGAAARLEDPRRGSRTCGEVRGSAAWNADVRYGSAVR